MVQAMKYIDSPDGRGGFTLVELLAALAVFAVMSAMAYGGLGSLLQTRQEGVARMESLAEMQMFFVHLARDVEQALPRTILDNNNSRHPAFVGLDGAGRFLELTHGGRSNPRGVARSALERVAYSLEEGRIVRSTWPVLDRVLAEEPAGEAVLEGVGEVEIRFLGADANWHGSWPMVVTTEAETSLPRAVEIVLEKSGWGRIRRVFEVAGGA